MRAASIAVNLETGETMAQVFDETNATPDEGGPVAAARGFQLAIQADWPGWYWTVVADDEARRVWADWQMSGL